MRMWIEWTDTDKAAAFFTTALQPASVGRRLGNGQADRLWPVQESVSFEGQLPEPWHAWLCLAGSPWRQAHFLCHRCVGSRCACLHPVSGSVFGHTLELYLWGSPSKPRRWKRSLLGGGWERFMEGKKWSKERGGLSSAWPFITVVFYQGGLLLVYSFIRVVFYQGGLWSE